MWCLYQNKILRVTVVLVKVSSKKTQNVQLFFEVFRKICLQKVKIFKQYDKLKAGNTTKLRQLNRLGLGF